MTSDVPLARQQKSIPLLKGFRELDGSIDLAICDLWGVVHNGLSALPEAIFALQKMRSSGCKAVFLSNAPRPRTHVRQQLISMGVPAELTDTIVTSGGLARDAVRAQWGGAKLYHLGPKEDHNTVDGLNIKQVQQPGDADIILATGLDYRTVEQHRAWLEKAAAKQIPFLCANPDRVVHVGEKLYLCAGAVADLYVEMGGPVHWYGKPTAEALLSCAAECGMPPPAPDRAIMIGDSLQTDIAGAKAAGYKSLLVAAGIHREEWPRLKGLAENGALSTLAFHEVVGPHKPQPNYIIEKLVW